MVSTREIKKRCCGISRGWLSLNWEITSFSPASKAVAFSRPIKSSRLKPLTVGLPTNEPRATPRRKPRITWRFISAATKPAVKNPYLLVKPFALALGFHIGNVVQRGVNKPPVKWVHRLKQNRAPVFAYAIGYSVSQAHQGFFAADAVIFAVQNHPHVFTPLAPCINVGEELKGIKIFSLLPYQN